MIQATNYQYVEDEAHVSGDRGTAALVVRKDAATPIADADGDYTLLQVDADGNLRIVGTVALGTFPSGTLGNGAQTVVGAAAVQVLAANSNRKKLIVQNVGIANVRVGVSGVTNTTGMRLVSSGTVILEMPHCPTQAIFAIREGAVSSTVFAQEVT